MSRHVYCWQLELTALGCRLMCVTSDNGSQVCVLLSDRRTYAPLASYPALPDDALDFCFFLVGLVFRSKRFPTHLEVEFSLLEVKSLEVEFGLLEVKS